MKIHPVGDEVFHADRHDETNSLLFAIVRTRLERADSHTTQK